MRKVDGVLNTICFECVSSSMGMLCRKGYPRAKAGGFIDTNTTCKDCPIGYLQVDGTKISSGKPSTVLPGIRRPGDDCTYPLTPEHTWIPCLVCKHATVTMVDIQLNDLGYCVQRCPAKEIRDFLDEAAAAALVE